MKTWTRLEARILPESKDGLKNVVTELVVGMTLTDEDSQLSCYRDTLVSLPDPDESFIAFEDIDEAWCLAIAEKVAADNDWETSMTAEVEAAKSRPISKQFKFQEPKVEA